MNVWYRTVKMVVWVVLLVSSQSYAWTIVPGGTKISAVLTNADEDQIIVNLPSGGYWRSDDAGQTWIPFNQELCSTHYPLGSEGLQSIDAAMDTVIARSFFSTYPNDNIIRQQISVSEDGGTTWSFPTNDNSGNYGHLMLIDNSNHDCMIFIDSNTHKISYDFGSTWEEYQYDTAQLQKYQFIQDPVDPNTLYCCCVYAHYQFSGILCSYNRGLEWISLLEGHHYYQEYNEASISDIDVLTNGDLLGTVKWSFENDPIDSFLRSSDGGQTWTEEYPDLPARFYPWQVVEFPEDPGHLLLRGDPEFWDSNSETMESYDYGHTFVPVAWDTAGVLDNTVQLSTNQFNGVVYACPQGDGVWVTHDNGQTWEEFPTPDFGSMSNYFFADGWYSHVPEAGTRVQVMLDDEPSAFSFHYPDAGYDSSGIAFPVIEVRGDTLTGLYARRSRETETGYLYTAYSYDRGASWELPHQSIPIGNRFSVTPWKHCYIGDQEYIIISTSMGDYTDYRAYVTSDHGSNWSFYDAPDTIVAHTCRYHTDGEYLYASYKSEGIYRIPLSGGEWESLNYPVPTYLKYPMTTVWDDETGDIYTFSALYGYRYHDGEWEMLGLIPHGNLQFVGMIPRPGQSPVFVGTAYAVPYVYISTDGGYEWSLIDPAIPYETQIVQMFDVDYDPWRDRLWLNSPLGMMWEDSALFTSVDEDGSTLPEAYDLLTVHPNPFNEQTTITFKLRKPGSVSLELYNTLGQKLQTLVEDQVAAGEFEVSVDASSFASGTYFLRLSSPDGDTTRRIVLLR